MALNRFGIFTPADSLAGLHSATHLGLTSELSRAITATSSLTSAWQNLGGVAGIAAAQQWMDTPAAGFYRSLGHAGDARLGSILKDWASPQSTALTSFLDKLATYTPSISGAGDLSGAATLGLALSKIDVGLRGGLFRDAGNLSSLMRSGVAIESAMQALPSSVAALATADWHRAFENKGLLELGRTIGMLERTHAASSSLHLGAAARIAAGVASSSSLGGILSAVERAHSSLLGAAVEAVASAFPSHAYVASEALAALSLFELEEDGEEPAATAPLASALAEVRTTLARATTIEEVAERAVEATVRVATTLEASEGRAQSTDRASLITFITLVLAALQVIIAVVQVEFARRAEGRADQQQVQAAADSDESKERAEKLQAAVDRLVRLQEREVASRAGATPDVYLVVRTVRLRTGPSGRASQGVALQPGAVVSVVERRGKWVRIVQSDHIRDTDRAGWVLKKYLERAER